MKTIENRRPIFLVFLGLIALALGGSVWSWTAGNACASCGGARSLAGTLPLAPVGAAVYLALLALGIFRGASRFLFGGVLIAAAGHLALLTLLLSRGVFCAPCVATGAAALAAAGVSFAIDPVNLARAGILLPLGAIGAHVALFLSGGIRVPPPAASVGLLPAVEARKRLEELPQAGQARMTVYGRADCRYCAELEEKILPELCREFGARLLVHREEAPPGIPTPTIVIAGAKGTVFPGLPPVELLKEALRSAMGEPRHDPSVFSKSR